jgi:hypothetical protein
MGVKEALEAIGRQLSGGALGSAAKTLSPAEVRRRNDPDVQSPAPQASSPAPQSSAPASKMVDPATGIRFKKGGIVMDKPTKTPMGDRPLSDLGKNQKKPKSAYPAVGNTVPSTGGYKAGGMVRRGYGKARGA